MKNSKLLFEPNRGSRVRKKQTTEVALVRPDVRENKILCDSESHTCTCSLCTSENACADREKGE